jgi:hypothetical protein
MIKLTSVYKMLNYVIIRKETNITTKLYKIIGAESG